MFIAGSESKVSRRLDNRLGRSLGRTETRTTLKVEGARALCHTKMAFFTVVLRSLAMFSPATAPNERGTLEIVIGDSAFRFSVSWFRFHAEVQPVLLSSVFKPPLAQPHYKSFSVVLVSVLPSNAPTCANVSRPYLIPFSLRNTTTYLPSVAVDLWNRVVTPSSRKYTGLLLRVNKA